MTDHFEYDVFLSHNSKDKPRVRRLAERLRAAGVRVWLDEWVIKPGDDIYLAIERGLAAARVQVLCLSQAALDSEWVTLERSTVLFRDPGNKGRRFIPLLLDDCDLPDTLRRYKYVDFREESEAGFAEVLGSCRSETPRLSPAPQPKIRKKSTAKRNPAAKKSKPLAVLELVLMGHDDWIVSMAVSPDGEWLVSASHDKTLKIWEVPSGNCRATLTGHTNEIRSVTITPDGKQIISGAHDHTIRVWNSSNGKQLAKWKASKHFVLSVTAMPDNRRVISSGAGNDPNLRIWEIATKKQLAVIANPSHSNCVAVTRNGGYAIVGGNDAITRYFNLESGECLFARKSHTDSINSVQLTHDDKFAITGSADKTVKIWNLETKACVGTLEGHEEEIHSVAISLDGSLIASTGFIDNTVRLWDWKTGACFSQEE